MVRANRLQAYLRLIKIHLNHQRKQDKWLLTHN